MADGDPIGDGGMHRYVTGVLEDDSGLVAAGGGEVDGRLVGRQQMVDRHRADQQGLAVAAREQDEELAHVGGPRNLSLIGLERESDRRGELEEARIAGFEAHRASFL
jgi:hypothetical protein